MLTLDTDDTTPQGAAGADACQEWAEAVARLWRPLAALDVLTGEAHELVTAAIEAVDALDAAVRDAAKAGGVWVVPTGPSLDVIRERVVNELRDAEAKWDADRAAEAAADARALAPAVL